MFQRVLVVAMLWLASDALASAVPKAVTDAVKKKYPDVRAVAAKQERERNEGKLVYSVNIERGKHRITRCVAMSNIRRAPQTGRIRGACMKSRRLSHSH